MNKVLFSILLLVYSCAASAECENKETANELLWCVVKNHTTIQIGNSVVKEASISIDVASQKPNPELEIEGIDESSGIASELSLMNTFELGGKRSARKKLAEKQRDIVKLDLLKTKEELIVDTVLDLYRLRQIEHEVEVVDEIITTFVKITKQFSKAGRLNPEDKISVSVFELALEENKLKKNSILNEKKQILAKIDSGLAKKISISKSALPEVKRDWAALSGNEIAGSDIQKSIAKVEESKADYNSEKADAWPDLALGPKIEHVTGDQSETKYGIALSVPLPLYQANGAGKERALAALKRTELQLKFNKMKLERQKEYLHEVYKSVSEKITKTLSNEKINIEHKGLHKMIKRGVVSAPIVIELHRQIMDFFEILHEQELQGVYALWKISALEGRIEKENLK